MLHLRLTQHPAGEGQHRVELALEGEGARRAAESTFPFVLSSQDEEELRWYLEEFLEYPQDPAPKIADRIEKRLAEVGRELFTAVFRSSDDARDLWARMSDRLADTRIEVVTGVAEANSIPWELLRDPKNDVPLALSAQAFVRAQPNAAGKAHLPAERDAGKVRILLVICRPKGAEDVPFRSVASRLVKGLDAGTRETYDLDVLRPPTFPQLVKTLQQAKDQGRPYHIVHFDGHGTFAEIEKPGGLAGVLRRLTAVSLTGPRDGKHGYLLFENPSLPENLQLVDGPSLGQALVDNDVSVLVLNACKSAHAEPAQQPGTAADPHSQVRAFGSLAQEVMDAGTAGVVAMRYNVYVVTAAQLAAELYASLAQGSTLGEAVTRARKQLSADPMREIAFEPRALQDWPVPVVYEAAPLQIFPEAESRDHEIKIQVTTGGSAAGAAEGNLDENLPPPRMPASTGGTRRFSPSTAPSTGTRSSFSTPMPAAARPPLRRSSPAGTR